MNHTLTSASDLRLIQKQEFIADLRDALGAKRGYAAGKLGASQKFWMYYGLLARQGPGAGKLLKFYQKALLFHTYQQCGVFPPNAEFCLSFNAQFVEAVRELDCLGLFLDQVEIEKRLIRGYELPGKLTYFTNQEPDRSVPNRQEDCYLPLFRGKKILLICPFAEFLRERARPEVFESVWAKTGKPWFYPEKVEALEFPYGFSRQAQERYATALDLLAELQTKVQSYDFDLALIGAAGLAIPLAAFIKSLGRVAIDLGGHLQILFGVHGKRWREQAEWRETYFNDAWTALPRCYWPERDDVCDQGAYW